MKPPRKSTRMRIANYLRAEATMMRSQAETGRRNARGMQPDAAAVTLRFAAQSENRAKMFEESADWVGTI